MPGISREERTLKREALKEVDTKIYNDSENNALAITVIVVGFGPSSVGFGAGAAIVVGFGPGTLVAIVVGFGPGTAPRLSCKNFSACALVLQLVCVLQVAKSHR